jgi:hypothetical protein
MKITNDMVYRMLNALDGIAHLSFTEAKEALEAAQEVAGNKEEECLELLQKFLDYSDADYVPNSLFDRARYLVDGRE